MPKKKPKTPAQYQKARYDRLWNEGKCTRCEVTLNGEDEKHTYCSNCRAKLRNARLQREAGYPKKKIKAAGNGPKSSAEIAAIRRKKAREAGKCGICTTRPVTKPYKTCLTCRERAADSYAKKQIGIGRK